MKRTVLIGFLLILVVAVIAQGDAMAQLLGDRSAQTGGESGGWMPSFLRDFIGWVVVQQAYFSQELRRAVAAYRDGETLAPAFTLIAISFLYGVFHAVGPGHGKAVVASYFMARESLIRRGLALGWLIAGIQAMVAIVLVALLGWALDFSRMALLDSMPMVEAGSYALIVVLGIGMTWAAIRGQECDHDHGLPDSSHADDGHSHASHDHTGHDHASHAHHGHSCGHHHHSDAPRQGRKSEFLAAAVVSGMRPCTGALIVLLFALANGIFLVGALATVAMGVGVAITVSMIGIAAILARRGLVKLSGRLGGGGMILLVPRILSVLFSLAICLIGILLLMAALQRMG